MKLSLLLASALAYTAAHAQQWSFTGPHSFQGSGDGPIACVNFEYRNPAAQQCYATVDLGIKIVWYEHLNCAGAQTQVAGPADDLAFQTPISTRSYAVLANP